MIETQRRRRGHAFMPPTSVVIPKLGKTEKVPVGDKLIPLHYFAASGDWWIAELDRETGWAFGYVKLSVNPDGAEWGYIDLAELETLNVMNGLVIVERDCYWTPCKFSEIEGAH